MLFDVCISVLDVFNVVLIYHCRLLFDLISSYENNHTNVKKTPTRRAVKLWAKLSCTSGRSHHVDAMKKKLTIPMTSFDAQSFQRLMTYIHSGTLTIDPRTVMGKIIL